MITFDDFKKLEIKIGKIKSAEKVEGADKLLKLIIDIGSEERQIIAGIAGFIKDPETLIGKEVPILTNLKPRNFKGLKSEGMILAADQDGEPVLLHPEKEVPPGIEVK